jgi:hypothetical protein
MQSGREALAVILQAIDQERRNAAQVEERLAESDRTRLALERERGTLLGELARLRWRELGRAAASPPAAAALAHADAAALAALARRDRAWTALQEGAETLRARIERERAERGGLIDAEAEAERRLDEALAVLQDRLGATPDYVRLRDAATEAERTAAHAEAKAQRAEAEAARKGGAYLADPLFAYLLARGHGTPHARGWGVTRLLDDAVARLIGFADARLAYERLQALPLALRGHAERVVRTADEALERLAAWDRRARDEAGIPALEAEVLQARARIATFDEGFERSIADLAAIDANRARLAQGEDPDSQAALQALATAFEGVSIVALREQAMTTPTPDDDAVVARLAECEDALLRRAVLRQGLEEAYARHRGRVTDLERFRIEFSRRRYDQADSLWERSTVETLVGQLLLGALTRDAIWRLLESQRRQAPTRSDPTFGSGGFGRGSPWSGGMPPFGGGGMPGARPGLGGGRPAGGGSTMGGQGGGFAGGGKAGGGKAGGGKAGGGFGGGGFTTGGGFGGGGARTGGGFGGGRKR